ncbi:MAG: hypothetical protein Kow0022_12810 [Phycisphaerales bacterium]
MRLYPVIAAAVLLGTFPCVPAGAEQPGSTWSELARRFEQAFEQAASELDRWSDAPAPLMGIFVPATDTAEAAGALPSKWKPLSRVEQPPPRVVLLVHGLDEPGDIWSELAPALVRAGHAVARFEYPNDQHVQASASLLIESLRAARASGIVEISIVAHSMGGLVTFDALTREDGYAGDAEGAGRLPAVRRFITIGTPWLGSPFARFRVLAEIREQVQRWSMDESWDVRPLLRFRTDGLGEAGEDLAEDSELIRTLQARPLPEGIILTEIAGRVSQPEWADVSWMEDSQLLVRLLGRQKVSELIAGVKAASGMLGDGVVPVRSALGRPAEDRVIIEANHRGLVRSTPIDFATGGGSTPPAIAVILDRLAGQREEQAP